MLHEMIDASGTTTHMPLQALAHHGPAKPWSVANGRVGFLNTEDPLFDEVKHLAIQRRLKSIGHVPRKLFPHMDGFFANRSIEIHRPLDCLRRRPGSADHFHERDDVRRVERMPHQNSLWMLAF